MAVVRDQKKYMFSASAVPDEVVKAAQVVIVTKFSWHVIAPAPYRMHCLLSFAPVPAVTCPVVDVKGVKDEEGMGRVIHACMDPTAGVFNLNGLLTGLEALGAVVSKQKAEGGIQKAADLSKARMEKKEKRGMRATRPTRRVRVH